MISFEKNHKCLGLARLLQQRDQGPDWGYVAQRARAEPVVHAGFCSLNGLQK